MNEKDPRGNLTDEEFLDPTIKELLVPAYLKGYIFYFYAFRVFFLCGDLAVSWHYLWLDFLDKFSLIFSNRTLL